MKSWLPTTLLLLYFTYYVFAIQDIELDPWSVGELMTARTLPSIVGVIALAVIIIQIVETLLQRPRSRLKVETRIDKAVQSDTEALVPTAARIAPLAGTVFSFGLYVVSIDVLGFNLASMGFLTATAWILVYRQPLGFIGVCVGVPLLLAELFNSIGIYLPAGTWIGGP